MTDAQVAGGHKATLKNPNVSKEAKEHSKQVLEEQFGGDGLDEADTKGQKSSGNKSSSGGGASKSHDDDGKNPDNVARGLKATLNNPNVSDQAKENAQARLDDM